MAKHLKRAESGKSHSWWWDSHISPKNSKWLAQNLHQMDESVKRMLKLIEEDGDSFAKKAEMYYQKRPDLILLVEEFYRMYRSLAERYDNLTGELRKNVSSHLQSPRFAGALDESSSSSTETSESELDDSSSAITNHTDDLLLAKVAAYERELQVQNYKSLEGAAVSESSQGKMTKIQEPGGALHDYHLLLNEEGSESCKLQERIDSLLAVLSERECKIRELERGLSDSERKAVFEAEEITKYLEEQTGLKEQLREHMSRCESLIGENTVIRVEKADCESKMEQLKEKSDRLEGCLETLRSDKGRLQKEIDAVRVELSYRDEQVEKLEGHLHQLHMEHAILISNAEKANELVAELEDEIERKKKVIADCWEEKREAIRQLCFSMEHYRSSYQRLRQAVGGTRNRLLLQAMVVAI